MTVGDPKRVRSRREPATGSEAAMTRIPILNIYYMLCYAWGHVQERDTARLEALADLSTVYDLLGKVLAGGVNHLVRRGMDRGYLERREDLAGMRGKLVVGETVKRALKARARAACDFEELSADILRNRILRASLRRLLQDASRIDLAPDVRGTVRSAYRKMPGVSPLRLTRSAFTRVQLAGGNRRLYRFLLSVCWLIHEGLGVDERRGHSVFRDFRRGKGMWKLFEDFVIGFYRRERRDFSVRGRRISWSGTEGTTETNRVLVPGMQADVILESKSRQRRIILDTKFYTTVLKGGKLNSGHLYQLLAYLRNRQARRPVGAQHEGILLYAQSDERVRANIRLEGFRIQARTVDLNRDWPEIHREMLAILDSPSSSSVRLSK